MLAGEAPGAIQRFLEVSLFLMLLTGMLAVVATDKLDPVTAVLAIGALGLKGVRWWRRLPPEVSEGAARRLMIIYLIFVPLDFLFVSRALTEGSQNRGLFSALLTVVHLLVFAMVVRLYSARTTRDYLFLAMVSFALVLVSAILTVETSFLGFVIAYLGLSISTFMGLEMRRGAEGAVGPPLAAGTPAARRVQRSLGWTTVMLALGASLAGAVVFLLLPRVTAGYLSSYNFQPTLITGFSDEVQLGQIARIKLSQEVVMRVVPEGGPGQFNGVYLRGRALTTLDADGRWHTPQHPLRVISPQGEESWYYVGSMAVRTRVAAQRRMESGKRVPFGVYRPLAYRVFLEPIGTNTLFLATRGFALRGTFLPGVDRAGLRRRGYLNVDRTGAITNPAGNYGKILYDAQSMVASPPPALLRESVPDYPEEIKQTYLQLPPFSPRLRALAERVTANAATAYDKAVAIQRFLKSTDFKYSLEPTGASIEQFIFSAKRGHCEYFAAAMVVMLRSLGIPASYVTGFQPGEYNDVGGHYIVRASDAHSWVEVYFPEWGWVTFDPTPPAPAGLRGILDRLALYADWAELMWIDWVVNYNYAQQMALAQSTQRNSLRWSASLRLWGEEKYQAAVHRVGTWRAFLMRDRALAAALAALLLAIVLGGFYLARAREIRAWLALRYGLRISGAERAGLATLQYQQMLRLLARRGWHKPPGQTAREFAWAIETRQEAAPLVPQVGRITALYEAARFGSATASDAAELAATLGSLRLAVRSL